ncbi:MAG: MmgE/PrpD family protein [Candidatus Nanopelagicales bacterium]
MSDSPTLAERLAQTATNVAEQGLSEQLRAATAQRVTDVLGNALGAAHLPVVQQMRGVVAGWGGTAQASVVNGQPTAAPNAALLNGTMAHALDFDDTHLPSVLHPSASVVPAALAAAELVGASGPQFLDAVAVGVEVTCRLGMAGYDHELGNSVFFEHGLHATSITGTIGSAVACAMLLAPQVGVISSTIGIAASMGAGLLEANRTGGTVKRIHCGWAAHGGVIAAQAAAAGVTGPPTVLEGRFGFLQAYLGDRAKLSAVTDNLGQEWVIEKLFFKPYPCNHFTHAGIDAARRMKANGVDPAHITQLRLGLPTPVMRTIAEPADEKAHPRSGYHAAFSGPFTVASAFYSDNGLGLFHEDFSDEAAQDPQRLALAAKVVCEANAECDAIVPYQFPAVLTATLDDGTEVTEKVLVNRGGPDNPLSDDELAYKFSLNARETINTVQADLITQTIRNLVMGTASLQGLGSLLQGSGK